ncbi:MAG: GNAT family N-acetyltransferase [Acidobacteriota bacterium]
MTRRRLRPAGPGDRPFLRDLAGEAFSHLGQYARMVPRWIDGPGASGIIALEEGQRVGFAITCLTVAPVAGRPDGGARMGLDLMAIATVQERRRTGVGRWLLDAVVDEARRLSGNLPIAEVTLTMEEGNTPALRLFESRGFRRLGGVAAYPRGQRALNFSLPLVG